MTNWLFIFEIYFMYTFIEFQWTDIYTSKNHKIITIYHYSILQGYSGHFIKRKNSTKTWANRKLINHRIVLRGPSIQNSRRSAYYSLFRSGHA